MAQKGHNFLGQKMVTKAEAKEFDRLNDLRNIEKTEALIKAGKYPADALAEWRKDHPEPKPAKEEGSKGHGKDGKDAKDNK